MLAQERKRSERSGKPFILLLLKGNGFISATAATR